MNKGLALVPEERVAQAIFVVRGQKVMLDRDLAKLYGIKPTVLRQQVKRNVKRFPADFMFRLSTKEAQSLVSQFVIPDLRSLGGSLPLAFTEHGALMLGNVLKSNRAVEVSIIVVRAFVHMRQLLSTNIRLVHKLEELERRVSAHDGNIRGLIIAIKRLMKNPESERAPIGFGAHYKGSSKKQK